MVYLLTHDLNLAMFLKRCLQATRVIPRVRQQLGSLPSARLSIQTDFGEYFRTTEVDPSNHNLSQVGRIYTIPDDIVNSLGPNKNLFPKSLHNRNNLFGEHSVLVRKPALEIINYLKQLDWKNQKASKFILWGPPGSGKSVSMSHVLHYCHMQNLIILNFRYIRDWFNVTNELSPSEFKEGRLDHVLESKEFLKEFLLVNESKLDGLKTHKNYKWSQREDTESGSPLKDVVTMGLDRPKFAADCLNVLLKELKLHCQEGSPNCKVVTFIDAVNVIFEPKSLISKVGNIRRAEYFTQAYIDSSADTDELSVIYNLKKMLVSDYPNSAVVATVDRKSKLLYDRDWRMRKWRLLEKDMVPSLESDSPFDLLSQPGWEMFDPFVPVEVTPFDRGELDVMIDYYVQKRYIRELAATDAGRQEIHFLTGRNPKDFFDYSNYW